MTEDEYSAQYWAWVEDEFDRWDKDWEGMDALPTDIDWAEE